MNPLNISPLTCLIFGLVCGLIALIEWRKEIRDRWHPGPRQGLVDAYNRALLDAGRPALEDSRPLVRPLPALPWKHEDWS